MHGSDLRIALLTEGEFFGETDLVSDKPSDVTVRTITPCVLLTLSRKDLDAVLSELPNLSDEFRKAIDEHLELRSTVNRYGERNIDLVSGFAENVEIPETFVDYSATRANTPCRPCRRWCACIRASRTCTTARSTNSKSRCG